MSRQQSGQGRFEPAPQRPGRALERDCFPNRKEQKQTNRTLTGLKGDYGEKHNLRTVCRALGAQPAALSTQAPQAVLASPAPLACVLGHLPPASPLSVRNPRPHDALSVTVELGKMAS